MNTHGGPAQPDPGVSIPGFQIRECLHESAPRVIYRAVRDTGEEVVLKTLRTDRPRRQDVAELRREFHILERLNVAGVIRVHSLVAYGSGNVAIEMSVFGQSLAEVIEARGREPFALDIFFKIAIQLAQTLGALHEMDLVHKDVIPQNMLVDPGTWEVRLIDFGICSELSRERQSGTIPSRLEGSLPYISPEQTGRLRRDLDYRSDYYSLGVTFFQLLTGRLPFVADNVIEWVHRHISQPPPAAHAINREVPADLSAVVMKLMAKNAEDRYQSTRGLIADLEHCRDVNARGGSGTAFALGRSDVSRAFRIPQTVYGREDDVRKLVELFDDVAHGAAGLCLVSGSPGVGKSTLVSEMGKAIVRERGYLIEGKFDQFQQSSAYGAFALAFRGLIDQILGEPAARLQIWRDSLQAALGANAQLIVDLVPELSLVMGAQPPVPALAPAEAQNRFQIVFLNFVKVFASAGHPLVIFMDDLQWSDIPTLNLIARLAGAREMNHLLIICAFRNQILDASHPLTMTLDQLCKTHEVVELILKPLDLGAVERLIADTLGTQVERCRTLSQLVYEKADGNPFFTKELLRSLHADGAIVFDPKAGSWSWNTDAVRAAPVGANVVEFMEANLRRLPSGTQQVLRLAACIGNTFDLRTLSIIAERTPAAASSDLHPALTHQMIVPLNDSYKFVDAEDRESADTEGENPIYRFQHDRVQQAAYALIDREQKQAVNLSIGRFILQHCSPQQLNERLMDTVGHLNAGRALIECVAERTRLARMNLDAGRKAVRSSAYDSALGFLHIGVELLGPTAWNADYDLMLALARETQQCAYLTGGYEEADGWTETILSRARTALVKAEILSARTRQYATLGRMRESLDAALLGLAALGLQLNANPTAEDVAREIEAVAGNLAGRDIAALLGEAEIADPNARVALQLLMEAFAAAFLSGSGDLFPYLVLTGVNLSLRTGASPESAFSYAAYGMLLCGALNNAAKGYQYGKLAVAMNERFNDIALKSRIIYVYAMFIHHWSNHWSSMTPWFVKGMEAGYQSGDLLYLAYNAQDCILWDPTLDLATASQEQRKYLAIVKDCEYRDSYDSGTLFLQMQLNFQGLTSGAFAMNDASFDEIECVDGMRKRGFMTGIANYHIYKAEIHALYGDYQGALEHVAIQDGLVASAMSLPQLVRFCIVAFLTRAALYPQMAPAMRAAALERLRSDLRQMSAWAVDCKENFEHLQLTMEAELARLTGAMPEALALYERAIAAARGSGFLRDEAQANELTARYLLALGLPRAADGYLREARYLCDRWGARRKVEQLEREYPQLRHQSGASANSHATRIAGTQTIVADSASLDINSVMKASQTIAGEIVVDQLLKTTLQLLLENAGGRKAYFAVQEDDDLVIRAYVDLAQEAAALPLPMRLSAQADLIVPLSVVNNVLRTGRLLVLNDPARSGRFASDPYIALNRPLSVMCVPIQRHDRFNGAIYMENGLTVGAFSEERVEVIRLLSAQAAISLENAKRHEDQVRLIAAQRRFVPEQFLESLGHSDIAHVGPGEFVAREMSVLFADLRSFTPLAERLGPRATIELLNRHFTRVSEPIIEAGGFIDSYTGDEVMALFPLPADSAVRAGVAMFRALNAFNAESAAAGGPELSMGAGINTGPLVLGTVGSADRLKCGVVGDTVNTASRIEQLTKRYAACLLIGEHTFRSLREPGKFTIRRVDRVATKGKQLAISLYEVLDSESPERRRAKESTRDLLEQALALSLAGDFAPARDVLEKARAIDPADSVLALLFERCARYAANPPRAWLGAEQFDEK